MKYLSVFLAIALVLALFAAVDGQTVVVPSFASLSGDVSATSAGVVTVNQMTGGLVVTNGDNLWLNPSSGSTAIHFRNAGGFEGYVGWNSSTSKVMLTTDGTLTDGITMDSSGNVALTPKSGNVQLPSLAAPSGHTYYLCINSSGNVVSQTSACGG